MLFKFEIRCAHNLSIHLFVNEAVSTVFTQSLLITVATDDREEQKFILFLIRWRITYRIDTLSSVMYN